MTDLYGKVVRQVTRKTFRFFESYLKVHVTPVHFYSPIPAASEMSEKDFDKVYDCAGMDLNPERQVDCLREELGKYIAEFTPRNNSGLSNVDAAVLHSMIRWKKPEVVIEIGSGESTLFAMKALELNIQEGRKSRMYAVEPYPRDFLRKIQSPHFTLIPKKVQNVDLDLLATADLLFIDSSHVSKMGSDVNFEILEILPKLKVGAIIHWHDITIPTNYSREWMKNGLQFWNETYMVQAFMMYNKSFQVLFASRFLQLTQPEALREHFPFFDPKDPSQQGLSFWIERTA